MTSEIEGYVVDKDYMYDVWSKGYVCERETYFMWMKYNQVGHAAPWSHSIVDWCGKRLPQLPSGCIGTITQYLGHVEEGDRACYMIRVELQRGIGLMAEFVEPAEEFPSEVMVAQILLVAC